MLNSDMGTRNYPFHCMVIIDNDTLGLDKQTFSEAGLR